MTDDPLILSVAVLTVVFMIGLAGWAVLKRWMP